MARRRLPAFVFEFLESGAEDEISLRWNRELFRGIRFVPRTLIDTRHRHISARLLGRERPSPLIIAPTGHNGMLWRDGDLALARAAAKAGIPFTLATLSNAPIEKVAAVAGDALWMQLYVFSDPKLTRKIIQRAKHAGCEALMFTTDSNVFGMREWDRRRFRGPGKLSPRSMIDLITHPRWAVQVLLPHGPPRFENVADFFPPEARDTRSTVTRLPNLFIPNINWDTVTELRDLWPNKLIVKGILSVEDSIKAATIGCDAIVLSNHGARHMDSCISPMEILSDVTAAIRKRITVIADSGFRRGSDVVKALAFGADAVMLGRAPLYGLAAGGQQGVEHSVKLLNDEIYRVLGQLGCCSLGELTAEVVFAKSVIKRNGADAPM
jgi:(S)-mandelate dehydrogenase